MGGTKVVDRIVAFALGFVFWHSGMQKCRFVVSGSAMTERWSMMMAHFVLEAEQLYLRGVEPLDRKKGLRWFAEGRNNPLLLGHFPFRLLEEEARSVTQTPASLAFAICATEDDTHIGLAALFEISWVDRVARYGILLGEHHPQTRGVGTEVTQLLLRYAFDVLNLNRVELSVFDFNTRAYKGYQQIGFQEEGRLRQRRFGDGEYHDEVIMAILRDDWIRLQLEMD